MTPDAKDVLRDARRRARMSQSELARRAGIAQPVISAYENGRREPALSTLARLIEATGHELDVRIAPVSERRRLPDTEMGRRLRRQRRSVIKAAERRGVRCVRVFGSVARGDDTATSDIDLLVDLDEGVTLIGLIGLERELADLLGRRVDVIPACGLKPGVSQRIRSEAIEL